MGDVGALSRKSELDVVAGGKTEDRPGDLPPDLRARSGRPPRGDVIAVEFVVPYRVVVFPRHRYLMPADHHCDLAGRYAIVAEGEEVVLDQVLAREEGEEERTRSFLRRQRDVV